MTAFSLKLDLGFDLEPRHSIRSFPPNDTMPVTFDRHGTARNLFRDDCWRIGDGLEMPLAIDFSFIRRKATGRVAEHNIRAAKLVVAHLMYQAGITSVHTLRGQWAAVRKFVIFFCSRGIRLDEVHKFDAALEDWETHCPGNALRQFACVASSLFANKDVVGFYLLSHSQISRAHVRAKEKTNNAQTAYIPARLHDALLKECCRTIDTFLELQDDFYLLHSDVEESISRTRGRRSKFPRPIGWHRKAASEMKRVGRSIKHPGTLARYFSDVRQAALIVVANYSIARKSELFRLVHGCYTESVDPHLGRVAMLESSTRKTGSNDHALWISTPKVKPALEALDCIQSWLTGEQSRATSERLPIFGRVGSASVGRRNPDIARPAFSLAYLSQNLGPAFLRTQDFNITAEDFEEAFAITPTLDRRKITIGKRWPFALHQFRRTMIVRCAASGIVSPQSIQFQAKHLTETMSWHYMANYWKLVRMPPDDSNPLRDTDKAIAEEFTTEYAKQYNNSIDFVRRNARFFTPYGDKLKQRMLDTVPLLSLAEIKRGEKRSVLKQTTLGLCAFLEFCEFGTARSVKGCMTKNAGEICTSALVDSIRIPQIREIVEELKDEVDILGEHPRTAFKRSSLEADIENGEKAIALIQAALEAQAA